MTTAAERTGERVVLVVEDDPVVREYMCRTLAGCGYRVLSARDGDGAVTLLDSLGPTVVGLVVSDFGMPRVDGLQLASHLSERWPTLPFLLVSGSPPPTWCGPFLGKPFSPSDLLTAVEDLLPPSPSGALV